MNGSWIDTLLAWIAAHPVLAGLVVFAIAFCDSLIILGTIVPALPLMIAVGVLIGMGELSDPYAVACAALGAFAAGLSGHSIPAGVLALCAGTLGYLAGRRNG